MSARSSTGSTALDCPICNAKIPSLIMNDHIDKCLGMGETKTNGNGASNSLSTTQTSSSKKVSEKVDLSTPENGGETEQTPSTEPSMKRQRREIV